MHSNPRKRSGIRWFLLLLAFRLWAIVKLFFPCDKFTWFFRNRLSRHGALSLDCYCCCYYCCCCDSSFFIISSPFFTFIFTRIFTHLSSFFLELLALVFRHFCFRHSTEILKFAPSKQWIDYNNNENNTNQPIRWCVEYGVFNVCLLNSQVFFIAVYSLSARAPSICVCAFIYQNFEAWCRKKLLCSLLSSKKSWNESSDVFEKKGKN